ncbi:MAG: NAD(P)/FAD-dependent oxidoreductase [Muribaculaceae bacterium]|nr:NAD(P)/FAD-dependent oxidoreductase [Muribaculaceae bacterium]
MKKNNDTGHETIVVIGGGFAGLNFVKKIDKRKYRIILLDRNNYHSFPPLFYQVVSAGIDPSGISFPLRRELRKRSMRKGVAFNMTRAREIDTDSHLVITDDETIHYDKLVIAAGTTNNFFNMPELVDTVYTLKSTAEAIRCRNDILDRLERASIETDPEKRRALLSFVVIGGGPTGVEVAGALGEMKRYVLEREYPQIMQDEVSITLIEGSDRVLRTMSERSSSEAAGYLKSLMVNVVLGHNMKNYTGSKVTLDNDRVVEASMVIWTAGVKGVDFKFTNDTVRSGRGNRLEVDEHCRVKGVDDVYALGDIALMTTPDYPAGHPQLAQVAIQQAKMVAKDLNKGVAKEGFRYKDKGTMATVGRNRAVVDLKHVHFKGWFAWITWMAIHLLSLLGMRNKVSVFLDWVWSYFTYSSSTRLLMHPCKYPLRKRWQKE